MKHLVVKRGANDIHRVFLTFLFLSNISFSFYQINAQAVFELNLMWQLCEQQFCCILCSECPHPCGNQTTHFLLDLCFCFQFSLTNFCILKFLPVDQFNSFCCRCLLFNIQLYITIVIYSDLYDQTVLLLLFCGVVLFFIIAVLLQQGYYALHRHEENVHCCKE